ncbi:MAG: thiosulfate oxidation carrier protein SoxY [Thiotrichaceae bacterium]|nr:thiosulfate oxidation carrier protein SoxY [Thiotrichaceae bacterium]
MKRRAFIKGTVVAGLASGAVSLTPSAFAEWAKENFEAKDLDSALEGIKAKNAEQSDKVKIKAPEIAENGMVVPITVTSEIEGTTKISVVISENPTPLVAVYTFGEGAVPAVKNRVKMGKSSDVIAIVNAGDKIYTNKVTVKVTKGGCGG